MKGLITKERTQNNFYGMYKDHEIDISRDGPSDNWYIMVWDDGGYAYDGWWNDSRDESLDAAIQEAIRGAQL